MLIGLCDNEYDFGGFEKNLGVKKSNWRVEDGIIKWKWFMYVGNLVYV